MVKLILPSPDTSTGSKIYRYPTNTSTNTRSTFFCPYPILLANTPYRYMVNVVLPLPYIPCKYTLQIRGQRCFTLTRYSDKYMANVVLPLPDTPDFPILFANTLPLLFTFTQLSFKYNYTVNVVLPVPDIAAKIPLSPLSLY